MPPPDTIETSTTTDTTTTTAAPATVDYGALYKTLTPENAEIFARKGFDKGGENGGPVDVNMLMNTIRNSEALIGKNNLPQPNLLDDKELTNWPGWKSLGVPDKPEGYELKRPEMPNGADGKPIPYDEEAEKVARQAMIDAKVPAKLAQKIFDPLVKMQMARAQAMQQQIAEDRVTTDAALNKEWGTQKPAKLARAENAANQLAAKIDIDPAILKQDVNAFMGSIGVVKLFDFLADKLGEDVIVPSDGRPGDISTPAGAKATLAQMESDPEVQKALNDQSHPQHAETVARRRKLAAIANPG